MKKANIPVLILLLTLITFICVSCGGLFGDNGGSGVEITQIVIREKEGKTTNDYPLTFGHVFRRGDVPSGYSVGINSGGSNLPSQFDIKSTYPDGSVRHAVISVRISQIMADADITLSLVRRSSVNNGQGLNKNAILATDVGATLELTGLNGSGYSGNLTANLRNAISESGQLDYWLRGNVCTEIIVRQDLNPSLNALWEVRFYPGTPYIRISHTIENINLDFRGNVNYALSINHGTENPAKVYGKADFQHNHSSRWRKVFWLGEEPPEVEIRYDLPYMISTGMILPYDTSLEINESAIATYHNTWLASDRDLMGNGTIEKAFPLAGGRADIGVLPKWTVMYLLSMDNRMREITLGNGEMSGHIPIHFRENDPALTFYGHTVSIDDRPNFYWLNNPYLPSFGVVDFTDWQVDQAHQPSLAYIPYLITGERWFLDEIYYWAGFNLFFRLSARNGGSDFRPAEGYSLGIFAGQLRGVAWSLRNVSDAVAVAQDSDIEKDYFKSKLSNNLEWLLWRNNPATTGHGLGAIRFNGNIYLPSWPTECTAPWMHDFMVLALADIARKHSDLSDAAAVRDIIGRFTVGRFTNPDEFPPFNGAGYYWPLSDKDGNFYTDADWARYWADVVEMNDVQAPATAFTGQIYGYSYAAIALGANAMLTHLEKGNEAYNFIKDNLSYNTWAPNDPTWAFVPLR